VKVKVYSLILLLVLSVVFIQSGNASKVPVYGGAYHDLIQKAAKEGKATMWVSGQVADTIREQIRRPDAKILLEATRVEDYSKPGCKGIKMKFSTPGTFLPMPDGTSKELDMGYIMNWCPK
jgi:hypothetical protein